MPLWQWLASYKLAESQLIWPIIAMMTFTDGWSPRADLQGVARSLGQHPINVSSTPHQSDNNDTGSNHNEEEYKDDEQPKAKKLKESSSIDVEVLKGIQAQIASLSQRDELKKASMTRHYPLE